jgi:phosphopantetheine--protein transferase-like protein
MVAVWARGEIPAHLLAQMHPLARRRVAALGPARAREWSGGRWCRALVAGESIRRATNPRVVPWRGSPGSISVTHKLGVCVAAGVDDGAHSRVGVDLEVVHASDVQIAEKVLTSRELAAMSSVQSALRPLYVAACFSAKEAAWKALSATDQLGLSYADIEISIEGGPGPGVRVGTAMMAPGRRLGLCARSDGAWVLTVATDFARA